MLNKIISIIMMLVGVWGFFFQFSLYPMDGFVWWEFPMFVTWSAVTIVCFLKGFNRYPGLRKMWDGC